MLVPAKTTWGMAPATLGSAPSSARSVEKSMAIGIGPTRTGGNDEGSPTLERVTLTESETVPTAVPAFSEWVTEAATLSARACLAPRLQAARGRQARIAQARPARLWGRDS